MQTQTTKSLQQLGQDQSIDEDGNWGRGATFKIFRQILQEVTLKFEVALGF